MFKKIIVIAVLLMAGLFGFYKYKTEYALTEILEVNEDNHSVKIYMVGEPEFPFGSAYARIMIYEDSKKKESLDVEIANDGKNLFEDNFEILFEKDRISITVKGEEMDEKTFTYGFE